MNYEEYVPDQINLLFYLINLIWSCFAQRSTILYTADGGHTKAVEMLLEDHGQPAERGFVLASSLNVCARVCLVCFECLFLCMWLLRLCCGCQCISAANIRAISNAHHSALSYLTDVIPTFLIVHCNSPARCNIRRGDRLRCSMWLGILDQARIILLSCGHSYLSIKSKPCISIKNIMFSFRTV
jgi:hypothetical protein